MRDDTTTSNGTFDEGVQLLISTYSKLQMPRRYPLHLKIFARVPSQFQNFCCQILQNGCQVHCCSCPHSSIGLNPLFQLSMDTSHRKLQPPMQLYTIILRIKLRKFYKESRERERERKMGPTKLSNNILKYKTNPLHAKDNFNFQGTVMAITISLNQ